MSSYDDTSSQIVSFMMGVISFEYDEVKNRKNIVKHGIYFKNAARVFFDYDRIEFYDKILKRDCTMVNTVDITREQAEELAFTEKELEELERARNMPITFDEDCPETTPEKAIKFRRVNPPRQQDALFSMAQAK